MVSCRISGENSEDNIKLYSHNCMLEEGADPFREQNNQENPPTGGPLSRAIVTPGAVHRLFPEKITEK